MENIENNNNEQQSIINEEQNKAPKKHKSVFFKVLITILIVILVLIAAVFGLYKATIDVADKNSSKFDYDFSLPVNIDENIKFTDFITYDSKVDPNTLFIDIPKDYVYNVIYRIQDIAGNINKETGIKLNRLGTVSNAQNPNLIDFYADITYKDTINSYVNGSVRYEITENNGVNIYIDKFVIGDGFPMFIYKAFLPFKDGDLLSTIKADDFDLLKNKTLDLSLISNLKLSSNSLKYSYDYMSNIKNIASYIFGDNIKFINSSIEKIVPIVLELTVGENKEEYIDTASSILPMVIAKLIYG